MDPSKPGYATTEFWMTFILHCLTLVTQLLPADSVWVKVASLLMSALAQMAYNRSRGDVKSAAILGPDSGSGVLKQQNFKMNSLIGLLILPALLLGFGGCAGGAAPSHVTADRATYDAIAPEYVSYVAADPSLTLDEKARRHRTVQTWDLRIRRAATQPTTQPGS